MFQIRELILIFCNTQIFFCVRFNTLHKHSLDVSLQQTKTNKKKQQQQNISLSQIL